MTEIAGFLKKIDKNLYEDLYWNVPERRQGRVNVIGGYAGGFRTPVRVAEMLAAEYPIEKVNLVTPEALRGRIPEGGEIRTGVAGLGARSKVPTIGVPRQAPQVENIGVVFARSTEVGSLADGEEILQIINSGDFNLLIGDLSKNAETLKAVASAGESSEKPLLITRDGVEAMLAGRLGRALMNENLIWLVALPQLQKMLRTVYYPKMLTMSQPLMQVTEVLHKFTLSYPCKIVTLNSGQILVAHNGNVTGVELGKTPFTPITVWTGELAVQVVGLNLYNPEKFGEATVAGLFARPGVN